MKNNGSFVISLDLELMWGCYDWADVNGYGRTNVTNVRKVVNGLLDLFNEFNIKATFAVVGIIGCKDIQDAMQYCPKVLPTYRKNIKNPYQNNVLESIKEGEYDLFFAPDIIDKLKSFDNIEIATHTFTHYFCCEDGQNVEQFAADLEQVKSLSDQLGTDVKSIVFPKNQVDDKYLEVCASYGISSYRGVAANFFSSSNNIVKSQIQRIIRLLDSYINISGFSTIDYTTIPICTNIINVPATRFLRPINRKFGLVDRMRLNRIKKEMTYAAKMGHLYHLWWHPHNFGANVKENLAFLREILEHYIMCKNQYEMQSYTIEQFAEMLKNNN